PVSYFEIVVAFVSFVVYRTDPTDVHVGANEKRQLKCKWRRPSKQSRVDGYQVALYDSAGMQYLKGKEVGASRLETVLSNLAEHSTYRVNVRSCFKVRETGEWICSEGVNASATTNPGKLSASSVAFHFAPHQDDRAHFNYTLTVLNRKAKVVCDATTGRCEATELPANSKIEVALVTCCKHDLCSPQSKGIAFTKPEAPLDLQMGSPTATTIYASWSSPKSTEEAIVGYRALAVDSLGKVTTCNSSWHSQSRPECTFRDLSPCMRYNISVRTCAREDDCSVEVTGVEYTLPGPVADFQMEQSASTNVSFTWTPQSMEVCELENITVVVQEQETGSIVRRCWVKQQETANSCTVVGLEPNTAYIAYAVACSATTHKCANKTDDINIETLPGVPVEINMSEVSARSVTLKWGQPGGRQDGLSGFLVRIYERSEGGQRVHDGPIANCTTNFANGVGDANTCCLDNLKPSTNYSITVTTFKKYSRDKFIFGDESEPIDFTTGRSTLTMQLLPVSITDDDCLVFELVETLFTSLELCIAVLLSISSGSFTIEYYRPRHLQYLSQIPSPLAVEELDACIESLDSNKQFIPHFMVRMSLFTLKLLKKVAVMGVEKEFHLTKNAGLHCKELNRYIDMLPYDQSIVILGRRWPRILDDPEPKITTTELVNNYINASYIRRPLYGAKGEAIPCDASDPPDYIATQGPMSTTVADFLTMVYEHRSKLILMLCRCEEDGKQKCKEYWDDESELLVTSATRSVKVTTSNVKILDSGLTCRTLRIMPSNEAEPWYVTQLHFTQWPDCEAADMTALYKLINFLFKFVRKNPVNRTCGPPIIHCSAGVGRSGTLIAASYLLKRLRTRPEKIDIFGTTLAIRRWRPNMVQTWVR
ncbi:unnamed protein product, partial [Hydatigera taeniaeformis]|uniref:Protein-tyrosine-phosphatase n=1 Tax=Hydatigena taeniaeformis TaxID=6205 RepID=A0A0R3X0Q4_HYDTA